MTIIYFVDKYYLPGFSYNINSLQIITNYDEIVCTIDHWILHTYILYNLYIIPTCII